MLQGLRDNLKGTVIGTVIVLFFILPMVVTGVGRSWLGSAAGTDAASVEGHTISRRELDREVYRQRQQLLSQEGVDPSADYLKEENLRQPILDRLVKKEAMLAASENGGMAVSDATVGAVIVGQKSFQTDGKFDPQLYRSLLARIGSSPAIFKQEMSENLVLGQLNAGIEASSFVTKTEKQQLVAIVNEQRSFFTVDVPSEGVAESVSISDKQIQDYYDAHQSDFLDLEKVSINYIELSVDKLAAGIEVSEEDIREQFEQELASFNAEPEYDIAHILIKDGEGAEARIAEVKAKLDAGEEFAKLAKEYSDDAGSKANGGSLGVMLKGVFPEAFETAVKALESGEVSPAVKTDSGTHFIKVVDKSQPKPPTFEDRKEAIASSLKRAKAEEIFTANLDLLEELTYDAPDLKSAADELILDVQASAWFERASGTGIGGNAQIRDAAFDPEVLVDGHNSRVIELAGDRAIVLRVNEHQPERVKSLPEVSAQISSILVEKAVADILASKADDLKASIVGAEDVKKVVTDLGYTYAAYDNVERSATVTDPQTRKAVFSAALAEGITFDTITNDKGIRLVGITGSKAGDVADMDPQQLTGLSMQISRENSRFEGSSYQSSVISNSKIKLN